MTDRDKLQQLFQAALQDSSDGKASLARAFPGPRTSPPEATVHQVQAPLQAAPAAPFAATPVPAFVAQPMQAVPAAPVPQVAYVAQAGQSGQSGQSGQVQPVFVAVPAYPAQGVAAPVAMAPAPMPVAPEVSLPGEHESRKTPAPAVLDDAASEELAILLDEQQARKKRQRRRASLCTLAIFLTASGSASAWFVQNPDRVQALKDAIRDIRSVADVQSMVAKYDAALERIEVRSKQIDQASMAMGIDPTKVSEDEDPYFEDEMRSMMGSEGDNPKAKTVGQRNAMLKEKFGHMENDHAPAQQKKSDAEVAKANAADGFEWKK